MFGKFWEHFWDNFGGKIGKLVFFFELKNISGPKYFLTDVFFNFLYPVVGQDVLAAFRVKIFGKIPSVFHY